MVVAPKESSVRGVSWGQLATISGFWLLSGEGRINQLQPVSRVIAVTVDRNLAGNCLGLLSDSDIADLDLTDSFRRCLHGHFARFGTDSILPGGPGGKLVSFVLAALPVPRSACRQYRQ